VAGGIDCQGAYIGGCESIVNACPRFSVIGGAKDTASLSSDKDVAGSIRSCRDDVATARTVRLCPKVVANDVEGSLKSLSLRGV
jgi:hypothetical protein